MRRISVLFGLALMVVLPARPAAAEVLHYTGEQTLLGDTVWSGEVLVDGILTVAAGVTLEIRPGTVVRFTRFDSNDDGIGEHEIFSQGTIRAVGTPGEPILFTSAEPTPQQADWGAINMMVAEEENRIEHCLVEYGYRGFHAHFSRAKLRHSIFRHNMRGAQFQESRVVIEDCRFQDNTNGLQFRDSTVNMERCLVARNQWGVRCVYSDVTIRDCEVRDNLVNGINIRDGQYRIDGNRIEANRRGLYLQRGTGRVAGNLMAGNSEHGIFLEDSEAEIVDNWLLGNGRAGVRWLNATGRLARNNIDGNGEFGLINDGQTAVDARFNWWGVAPQGVSRIVRDGLDRSGLGLVDHRAALTKALPLSKPETQVVP